MNYNQHGKREKTMKSRQHHQENFTLIELLITNTCQIYIYSKG